MKNIFTRTAPLILFFLFAFGSSQLSAQCPGCVIDTNCPSSGVIAGPCEPELPDATVGEAYDEDITFYMPISILDPGSGFTIELQQVTITNVVGLPLGLTWESDNSAGGNSYFPQSNPPTSELGCIKFCGTPFGNPGIYPVSVKIATEVYVVDVGITANQDTAYNTVIEVLPGTGGNSNFTFSPGFGCAPLDVDFDALIDFAPDPTNWTWDFGNGNTSTDKTPPTQSYTDPGAYLVTLQTDQLAYEITDVCVNGVNDNWCGDIEEAGCTCTLPIVGQCPDLYFKVFDANSTELFSSSVAGGATSNCWNNLNVLLTNPPYTIQIFDSDAISADDNLGIFAFNMTGQGTFNFSGGGTSGSITASTVVNQSFNAVDTIHVFADPPAPNLTLTGDQVSCSDSPASLASDADPSNLHQWMLDGVPINGATNSTHTATESGDYYVEITSQQGCTAVSGTQSITVVQMPAQPVIVPEDDTILTTSASGDLQWYFNGTAIPGATNDSYEPPADGVYSVELTDGPCVIMSEEYDYIGLSSINQIDILSAFDVYPNPSNGEFMIDLQLTSATDMSITVFDMYGKKVAQQFVAGINGSYLQQLNISGAGNGVYFLQLEANGQTVNKKIVVQ